MTVSDQLLLHLYACPGEPGRWPGVLDQICRETGARSAVVQRIEHDRTGLAVAWSSADHATLAGEAGPKNELAGAGNPRIALRRIARGLDRVVRDDDLFDPGDAEQARMQAQLAERGLGRFMGKLCAAGEGAYLGLALHRGLDDGADFSAAQVARFAALAPHVRQACELQLALGVQAERQRRLHQQLDQLRAGMLMCDGAGRVQWHNRSAGALLRAGDGIDLRDGRLRLARRDDAERLRGLIADVAEGRRASAFLTLGGGGGPLHVALQSPPVAAAGRVDGVVFLVLTRAGAGAAMSPEAIACLFGLSGAEARLAAGLVAGNTLEQYAAQRGVGIGTVRGQVKQVFAKTGATRQAELVGLLLTSAAAQLIERDGPD
ncbi:PAS domain-containing protein [Oxalobacteraceae bacterium OTU3CAMAD1]|nr:PAS domain-containing protein [Oxalobacteraceae bacterium OTU3CAMAD1]